MLDLSNSSEYYQPKFHDVLSDPKPLQPRMEFWSKRTSLPFDPIECCKTMMKKTIACPQCLTRIQVRKFALLNFRPLPMLSLVLWTDLMCAGGQGYLQQRFSGHCTAPSCSLETITKEKLAVRKLAEDLMVSAGNAAYLP